MRASDDGDQLVGSLPARRLFTPGTDTYAALDLQERERLRIGFDLHDGPVQTMASALLQVRMMRDLPAEECAGALPELESTLSAALGEMYAVIEDLRSHSLEADGLVAPIRAHVEALSERYGMDIHLSVDGDEVPVSRSLKIAVFRIIQEALSNIRRHSAATQAHIRIVLSECDVRCEVADNGCGFVVDEVRTRAGRRECFGLLSMRERARLPEGTVSIESTPGEGTVVSARIPIWQA
ncbi:MAG: sensor histidine kinase [Coriobacteriia bacterium]